MKTLSQKASSAGWTINYLDDKDIDVFMELYYKDSSILWAYRQINARARIAASDIWRYCALYAFGGFYIDDDANIMTPLDEVTYIVHVLGTRGMVCFKGLC